MTTRSVEAKSPTPASGVYQDERGAILVMGIFMCACMVSILWYLAGIGDAIVFRERMQEAADATAYSAAVLHARGMNLLVMINLIMACVLAVRVALKVAFVVLSALALAFSWVPGAGAALGVAAEAVNTAVQASDPIITGALEGLTAVEEIIPHVVPPAAIVGSYQVGERYAPVVDKAAAGNPVTTVEGLPVTEGSKGVLCFQAAKAVMDIIWSVFPGGNSLKDSFVGSKISSGFARIIAAGGDYFCGLNGSSSPPDFSSFINDSANEGCDGQKDKLDEDLEKAQREYQGACNEYRTSCANNLLPNEEPKTATPAQERDLQTKSLKVSTAQAEVDKFKGDKCREDAKKDAQQRMAKQSGSSSSGGNIAPRRVIDQWKNGIANAQMLSVATGDTKLLKAAPTGVKAGAWKSQVDITMPESAPYALAQAEYFYDCAGGWDSNNCNGKKSDAVSPKDVAHQEMAMWNFRWRARLRRFNSPFSGTVPGVEAIVGALNAASTIRYVKDIDPLNSLTLQNAALLSELGTTLRNVRDPNDLIIH